MRPLRIELQGFTAFRDRQVVSMEDLDLFVITGPTGAGKSSLLDAMIFALFGKVPRMGGQGLSDLVSQGLAEARIQLDFSVGGERYRVARRLRRKGANSATLERAEGSEWRSEVEAGGVRAVDKRVLELVKLSFEAFTRAVVLPQGEFQRFLRGDRDQRREVLSDLLGLGHYESMGARARARIRFLDASMEATQKILDDQFADATSEHLERAAAACDAASAVAKALVGAAATADGLDRQLTAIGQARHGLELRQAEISETRSALIEMLVSCAEAQEQEGVFSEAATKAENRVTAAETDVAAADACLVELVERHGSSEELVRAEEALKTHSQSQKDLARRQEQLEVVSSDVTKLNTSLEVAQANAKTLAEALAAAKAGSAGAEQAAQQASKAAQGVTDRLEAAKRATDELDEATRESTTRAERLTEAKEASERAGQDARAAEAEYAQLSQENTAAALAQHLRAGDPCPVCHRDLDADPDFDQHVTEALSRAEGRLHQARDRDSAATRGLTTAEAAHANASERVRRAQDAVEQALKGVDTVKALGEQANAADRASDEHLGLLVTARAQVETASEAESDARVKLENLTTTLANKTTTRDELVEDCKALRTRSAEGALTLQAHFEGEIPSDADAQLKLRHKVVSEAAEALAKARREASAVQTELQTATNALAGVRNDLTRIDADLRGSRVRLEPVHRQIRETTVVVGFDDALTPLPAVAAARDSHLRDLVSWCDAAAATLTAADAAGRKAVKDLEEQLDHLAEDLAVEVAEDESPAAALKTAEQLARDAKVRSEEAVEQAKQRLSQREQLSESVSAKQSEVVILRSLAAELRADRFLQFIIQQTLDLLAVRASEQLMKISGSRYSLTSYDGEFSVIDHANADEERSVKTLSGGETFLASLSLALALSQHVGELATEGLGAKLEAVFIDEGFGALDPETLEDVIDALERLRESNLMVGVITHVPALAERIRVGIRIDKQQNKSTVVDAASS